MLLGLAPALSPLGWFLFAATGLLMATYLYFWWMVIRASVRGHVSRAKLSNGDLRIALKQAASRGDTHRFLIQITTKGGAVTVVQRGIDEAIEGVRRFPVLAGVVRIEVITEVPDEVQLLAGRYRSAPIPVVAFLLPGDYQTPRGTKLKARALEYLVEQHRADPQDCYVVHYDEESVFTPENLARLVHRLALHPVGISEGMISYGLDWRQTTLLNKAMESNRPFGCHECFSVMTSPPPLHLHGSNLVVRQDLENQLGWDIGTLNGSALIAEDLIFGLAAYLRFGSEVFGWHHAEMIEQPPFSLKAAYKQRERWVFGALQALAHVRREQNWLRLSRRDRWHINIVIRLRVFTYALGFPVSLLALSANVAGLANLALDSAGEGNLHFDAPEITAYSFVSVAGFLLWMAGTQLGLFYNLRYAGLTGRQKFRDHVLVLLATPFAGIVDTLGPLMAVAKWVTGTREVAWQPTPKLAAEAPRSELRPDAAAVDPAPASERVIRTAEEESARD